MASRIRAPPGPGGARICPGPLVFLVHVSDPPRGRPFGGGGVCRTLRKETAATCVSYPEYFAITGHKKKEPVEEGLIRTPP